MREVNNIFGTGTLCDETDLTGKTACICCACMSIYSEYLSWANHTVKPVIPWKNLKDAENIILLGCQVTDLAILNDLSILEVIIDRLPELDGCDKKIYVGGCLGKRFDIPLPDDVMRIDNLKHNGQPIVDKTVVNYVLPYWIERISDEKTPYSQGFLFRDSYPLRIGAGCQNNCIYCTIRETRGEHYEIYPDKFNVNELISNDNVVLIADNPSAKLLYKWCKAAKDVNKPISIRNVEPNTICDPDLWNILFDLVSNKLLNTVHIPIQSTNPDTLKDMGRNIQATNHVLKFISTMRSMGVFTATNVIIDYKHFPNPMDAWEKFDYVSWNPYWDNRWGIDLAKSRYEHYLQSWEFKRKYPRLRE